MKIISSTVLKKNIILILFFGTLIGLHETFTGNLNIPYRSVILSSISIAILAFARVKIPRPGTSFLIMLIAVVFKLNHTGFHTCTTNILLCGPAALMLTAIGYELSAALFLRKNLMKPISHLFTCATTALFSFSLFAMMNTFILNVWEADRLINHIFLRGTLTAIYSYLIILLFLSVFRIINLKTITKNNYVTYSILSLCITVFWILGSI
jgi:hypothetical protein